MASHASTSAVFEAKAAECSHTAERGKCSAEKAAGSHFCARHAEQYERCSECDLRDKKKGETACSPCRSLEAWQEKAPSGAEHDDCASDLPEELFGRGKENHFLYLQIFLWFQMQCGMRCMKHTKAAPSAAQAFAQAESNCGTNVFATLVVGGWRQGWSQSMMNRIMDAYLRCSILVFICVKGGRASDQVRCVAIVAVE